VLWVSARNESLAMLFSLATLLAAPSGTSGVHQSVWRWLATALLTFCALASKETALIVLPMLVILRAGDLDLPWPAALARAARGSWLLALPAFAYLLGRLSVVGGLVGGYLDVRFPGPASAEFWYKKLSTLTSALSLVRVRDAGLLAFLASIILVVAVLLWALRRAPERKAMRFAIIWFLLAFVPLVQLRVRPLDYMDGRYLYQPTAALALLLGCGLAVTPLRRLRRPWLREGTVVLIVLAILLPALHLAQQPFRRAALLAERVQRRMVDIDAAAKGEVWFLDLPATLDNALVLRNALPWILRPPFASFRNVVHAALDEPGSPIHASRPQAREAPTPAAGQCWRWDASRGDFAGL
jgi:hypothetical protein